ncbi:MAG: exodeoxyribonuclease V subunit gamma [Deltaproteobacteria bacterium]|nr:exodeoxyribonuclease V subunit gamma [Deltaproteobacteria bacterium]MBI3387643.1 exodeoxyribonuclease V subunit gamma [Deltaproteobacteria bacterium]
MFVHRSNRAEALVEVLAEVVARPVAGPWAAECIVVQGRGMERWLSMQLASRLGVWANPSFPFPRHLILRALGAVIDIDDVAHTCFEPEILMWSIADLLVAHLNRPEFAPIRTYLAGDERGIRRIQLAERIARTFDQYVVYRPHMVLGWESGGDTHWQAVLWRAVVQRHGSHHVAAHARQFLRALEQPNVQLRDFPARVSVFGVSTLPPLHLELLAALSKHVELHLFLLSPSAEYWAEIRSRREMIRAHRRDGSAVAAGADPLHFEETNPLLASLGRLGRDFQRVLESTADYRESDRDLYADPGGATMLTVLQSDILSLRHRGPDNTDASTLQLDPGDDSITIHACHGPMREVEVVHDQLLALFDADPSLEPRHIVVMSPAIDAYAPFIDAVFGGASDHSPRIPYRIADRAVRATDDAVDAFLTSLTVLRGRMAASEVLDLLGLEPIRQHFGFVTDDLDVVRGWIKESGIRWGVDAEHRRTSGQPAVSDNTWRFGLDRLLLGYAIAGEGRRLYAGVLPYDEIEGTTAALLGRLVEFCETLFAFHSSLQTPRPFDVWRDDLGRLLHAMVASTNQTAHQHRQVHAALAELAEHARAGHFDEAVDLDTAQMQLTAALERTAPGRGFLTGGVTFCAMVPMRSIPFRVVCLLGMNDADFPRVRRAPGFDLMAQKPLPGDRSSRDDDRYLFLEALLSARERLIITYAGQSIRDNSEIPPSVVVSELLDVLGESFRVTADTTDRSQPIEDAHESMRQRLVVRHPLQPFSPRYFGADQDPRLFSYARHYYEGARALTTARGSAAPFLTAPLPLDVPAKREVSLTALARFFENPTRAFLQNRLSLYLGKDLDTVEDREPLDLDNLDLWKLGDRLLKHAMDGETIDQALPSMRASGALPPGTLGQCTFGDVGGQADALATAASALRRGAELEPLTIDAELDGTRIIGEIHNLWPSGLVQYQYSKLGGRHELGVWIRHLILNCLQPDGYPRESFLIGRPRKDGGAAAIRFTPVENAAEILRELLRLYWLGQESPLLLFDKASRTYAETLRSGKGAAAALRNARKSFEDDGHNWGDLGDEYVRQVFEAADPIGPDFLFRDASERNSDHLGFAEVAVIVLAPMLDHRRDHR